MPSKNTVVLMARVKNETLETLTEHATDAGLSLAKYLDNLAEEIASGKGVPHENTTLSEDLEPEISDSEFERLGFGGVLRMMRKKNYPDNAINKIMGQMREQISETGNYNQKKVREDWC